MALSRLIFATLALAAGCLIGCVNVEGSDATGQPLTTDALDGTGTGTSSSTSSSTSASSSTTGSSDSTSGDSSEDSTGEPLPPGGPNDPCDPQASNPCDDGLVCYQDSVTGSLTFCTEPCIGDEDCPGIEGWEITPVCGDGLCMNPCDLNGPPLCPQGWECLFEGFDMRGLEIFNCLPFECPVEPC